MPDPAPTILLISGDTSLIQSCQETADAFADVQLLVRERIRDADTYLTRDEIRLIVVHLAQESDTGDVVRLLHRFSTLRRAVPLYVVSDRYHAEQAWSLTRLGAADYLTQPLDRDWLHARITSLTVSSRRVDPDAIGAERAELRSSHDVPVRVTCKGMDVMMEQVRLVASQDTTILLGGETGTGKTRLARLIHEFSPRRAENFVAINCGALAADLIESEMFGHVKGAFTGADRTRVGKFAAAGRGTLLLDEIDALPLALQAKLLRAVEERIFEPVGCNDSQPVEARFIAASNRPLEREVEAGRFRADLYYRLNVVGFHLPPLREQPETVPQLAFTFLKECASRNGRQVQGLTPKALRLLEAYHWPGNIRELRNVIERAVALCPNGYIGVGDLPEALCVAASSTFPRSSLPVPGESVPPRSALRRAQGKAEAAAIMEALRKHANNRLRAALELGISRRTLYKKLHRYGLMERNAPSTNWRSAEPVVLEEYATAGNAAQHFG